MTITNDTLMKLARSLFNHARQVTERDGFHAHVAIAVTRYDADGSRLPEGQTTAQVALLVGGDSRAAHMRLIKKSKAEALLWICETDEASYATSGEPKAERRALRLYGESASGAVVTLACPVQRDDAGTRCGDIEEGGALSIGRLSGYFEAVRRQVPSC